MGQASQWYLRPTGWAYWLNRIYKNYSQIKAHRDEPASYYLAIFFSWYSGIVNVLLQPLLRQDELIADHAAVTTIYHETVAEAIVFSEIVRKTLAEEFWPRVKQLQENSNGRLRPYQQMEASIAKLLATSLGERTQKLFEETVNTQSKLPCLAERLEAIGYSDAPVPQIPERNVARELLSGMIDSLRETMDAAWNGMPNSPSTQIQTAPTHSKNPHTAPSPPDASTPEQKDLLELLRSLAQGQLTGKDAWRCTLLVEQSIDDRENRHRLLKRIAALNPSDARINLHIGTYLLAQEDRDGINALERAIQVDPGLTTRVCQIIPAYYLRIEQPDQALHYSRFAQEDKKPGIVNDRPVTRTQAKPSQEIAAGRRFNKQR
jgi:hypothetical protein